MRPGIITVLALSCTTLWAAQDSQQSSDRKALAQKGYELFTRVWTVDDGLGPSVNARSCVGCHAAPTIGGGGTDERSFVSVIPGLTTVPAARVFQRLRVSAKGAIDEELPPRLAVLRRAPSLLGSGLLERISNDEIAAGASETGSRGRLPQGRYGWKGHLGSIEEATAAAFANELGLSSAMFPEPTDTRPELSRTQISAVSEFIRSLPPASGNKDPGDHAGKQLFKRVGCATCHRPSFASVERHGAYPFTDLLLHDMGPALADGFDQGSASGNEFRTPPLWGIAKTGPPYLHDGRGKTLDEAIKLHGGEAERSAVAYSRLSDTERLAILAFLRSL